MAGWMGTGKSTLARSIAERTSAAVLDHDTTKSAILAADVPHPPAGAASYEVVFAVADDLLRQGHSVIIDSPSLYETIPARGVSIAARHGVAYRFVECRCPVSVAEQRIRARSVRPSQVSDADEALQVRNDPARSAYRPATRFLIIDTTVGLSACVDDAVLYLSSGEGPG